MLIFFLTFTNNAINLIYYFMKVRFIAYKQVMFVHYTIQMNTQRRHFHISFRNMGNMGNIIRYGKIKV